jgi:hypothetical protein
MSDRSVIRRAFRDAYERAGRPVPAAFKARNVDSRPLRAVPTNAKARASTMWQRLGALGDLRIPYGIPFGPITAYAEERLRELHWPRTMMTLRDSLERNGR